MRDFSVAESRVSWFCGLDRVPGLASMLPRDDLVAMATKRIWIWALIFFDLTLVVNVDGSISRRGELYVSFSGFPPSASLGLSSLLLLISFIHWLAGSL